MARKSPKIDSARSLATTSGWTTRCLEENLRRRFGAATDCSYTVSAEFRQNPVWNFETSASKRIRFDAQADAPAISEEVGGLGAVGESLCLETSRRDAEPQRVAGFWQVPMIARSLRLGDSARDMSS
jgi:hypothetical protein